MSGRGGYQGGQGHPDDGPRSGERRERYDSRDRDTNGGHKEGRRVKGEKGTFGRDAGGWRDRNDFGGQRTGGGRSFSEDRPGRGDRKERRGGDPLRGFRRNRDDRGFRRGDREGDRPYRGRGERRNESPYGGRDDRGGRSFRERGEERASRGGFRRDDRNDRRRGAERENRGFRRDDRDRRVHARKEGTAKAKRNRESLPAIPPDVTPEELDQEVRDQLRPLPRELADLVARHLVAAARALGEDEPERAYEHTKVARRFASRIGVVREAAGLAAYRAGEYADALSDLRAARRMTGSDIYLPIMADCERGLGRPERALDLIRSPEAGRLDRASAIELAIVESGARRDLGQYEAAVVTLQRLPELRDPRPRPWSARLAYAYADALADAGHEEAATDWFGRAMAFDEEGETDAAERYALLSGEFIEDLEEYTEEKPDTEDESGRENAEDTPDAALPDEVPAADGENDAEDGLAEEDFPSGDLGEPADFGAEEPSPADRDAEPPVEEGRGTEPIPGEDLGEEAEIGDQAELDQAELLERIADEDALDATEYEEPIISGDPEKDLQDGAATASLFAGPGFAESSGAEAAEDDEKETGADKNGGEGGDDRKNTAQD